MAVFWQGMSKNRHGLSINYILHVSHYKSVTIRRYNIGTPLVPVLLFKLYRGSFLTVFWFMNIITLVRFLQAVVWKRVMEINEELVSKAVNISVVLVCGALALMSNLKYKLYAVISAFSGTAVELPLAACYDGIDPLQNEYDISSPPCPSQ